MKELSEMTFDELVQLCQGRILLGIPIGKFNEQVFLSMDYALRWKAEQDKKKKGV